MCKNEAATQGADSFHGEVGAAESLMSGGHRETFESGVAHERVAPAPEAARSWGGAADALDEDTTGMVADAADLPERQAAMLGSQFLLL